MGLVCSGGARGDGTCDGSCGRRRRSWRCPDGGGGMIVVVVFVMGFGSFVGWGQEPPPAI